MLFRSSVAEFAEVINDALRDGIPRGLWVRGEIQSLNERAPHIYFNIVDDRPGERAQLRVQLFAPQRRRIDPMLARAGVRLENGIRVRISGTVDFWAQGGLIGMKMSDIDPRFTLGDMQASRDAVVKKLKVAGLYDENRERELPELPLRVGVITSVGTAAWHDVMSRFEESGLPFQLKVANVRVQGDGAVPQIVNALWSLGSRDDVDVIMMIRGGGSKTDLACFDAEEIAVAIAQCSVPEIGRAHV